jgi:hypothetical protein
VLASPWTLLIVVVVGVAATYFPAVMRPVGFAAVAGFFFVGLLRSLEGSWCPSCGDRSLRPDPARARDRSSYWCPSCGLCWRRSFLWGWREQPKLAKAAPEPPPHPLDPWSDGSLDEIHESASGTHGSLLKHKLARRRELDLDREKPAAPTSEADPRADT